MPTDDPSVESANVSRILNCLDHALLFAPLPVCGRSRRFAKGLAEDDFNPAEELLRFWLSYLSAPRQLWCGLRCDYH
jgi:hypothetical protein